jgi:CheY-like chemotaxis protein
MDNSKILIVEDEGIQAMNTKLTLLKLGFEVLPIAISGKSAIELALKHKPDLILMDIRLRGKMDGIEAAGVIMEKSPTPIIFISAYIDQQTTKRVQKAAPAAFLEKPVDEKTLNIQIKKALLNS